MGGQGGEGTRAALVVRTNDAPRDRRSQWAGRLSHGEARRGLAANWRRASAGVGLWWRLGEGRGRGRGLVGGQIGRAGRLGGWRSRARAGAALEERETGQQQQQQ